MPDETKAVDAAKKHEAAKLVPHFCHALTCLTVIETDKFFCIRCLAKLPRELKKEHDRITPPGVHWLDRKGRDYTDGLQACLAFLNGEKKN